MLLLALLAFAGEAKADELTVYDGTNTNSNVPFYGFYADYGTRCQFIIPATELAGLTWGEIEKLTFYSSTASASFNEQFTVYLKEVDNTIFGTAAFEDWSSMTAVYNGTIGINSNQMVINLSVPYSYEGGNLMIGFQVTTWGSSCPQIPWYGENQASETYTAVYQTANSSHSWNGTITREAFLPKTTLTYTPGTAPTVSKPTDLITTGLTAHTATMSWTSTESKWNLRYKEAGSTDWIIVNDVTKPYIIQGLMANTTYSVQVQAVNGEETSRWSSVASFTTSLGLPYRQYFETNNTPAGWQHYSGLLSDVQTDPTKLISGGNDYSWQFSSSSGAYIIFSGSAANGTKNWIVSPAVELGQASNLSFDVSLHGGYLGNTDLQTNNADDRFIVLASIDNGQTWTQLALWDNAGSERVLNNIPSSSQNIKINFPTSFAGKSVVVAFYAESTVSNNSNRLYLDNVIFDDGNRCIEPTDLTATNVTSRKATVGWTSEGDLFNLQYKKSGDAAWTNVNGINAKTYELTGLTPKTAYIFRVQTVCSSTKQSIWSEEGTFTTKFGIPFTETFVNSSRPEGWTSYSTLMSGVLDGTTKLSDHQNNGAWGITDSSGDYYAYVNLWSQYEKQWLVTPDIMIDVANSQLTFDLRLVDSDKTGIDDQFAVLATDDGGNTWTQLALWNNSGSTRVFNDISYNGEQVALDLSAYNGKTIRLAFYAESTVENASNVIRIDNVSVDVKPVADAHRPQNLAVSNITKNSATITWDADAAVTQWNIQYGARKYTFRYDKTSNTNSCDLTLLNAGTNYEVLVQAVSADGNSSWSNVSFVTDFPEDCCNISYELKSKNEYGWNGTTIKVVDNTSGIEVTSLTLAAGKSEESGTLELCNGRTYNFVWIPKDYYGDCSYSFRDVNGDEFLYADAGKTGQKTTLTSYKMDCTAVTCHQPKNPKADEVGFYSATVSWTPGDADQEKWEVVCRTSYGTPSATTVGTEVTTTTHTFSNLYTNYDYYIYVRGVKGEEKSKWSRCVQIRTKNAKATPTDVEADNETFTTADVDWTVNGAETKWNLRYREKDTYTSFTEVNGITTHPYTLTNLTPNTDYEIQVQPVYDDNSTGSWSEKGYAYMLDDKAMPSELTLTNMTTTTATVAWTKNGAESKWNVRYRKAAYSEEVYFDDFENGLGAWTVYTQGEAPQTDGWHVYESYKAHSGSKVASAWSWYNNTAYNADNWLVTPQIDLQGSIKFWVLTNDDWPDRYAVLLSTTGNAIDDFTVTLKAMAAGPTTDEWTEVSIDLSAYAGQKGYIAIHHQCNNQNYLFIDDAGLYINESPAGEWQYLKAPVTEPSYTLTNLAKGAEYEVQVQAVYDDESTGDWTDSFTFPVVGTVLLADDDSGSSLKNIDIIDALADLNEPVDIMLYGRKLYKDGDWNTLCLPFNVTISDSPLNETGVTVRELTTASISGTTLNLTFGAEQTSGTLQAGKPYIIKWTKDTSAPTIDNPTFTNVTVDKTDRSFDSGVVDGELRVRFLGTYNARTITAADKSILFLGAENHLYYPQPSGGKNPVIGACRAYFKIGSDGTGARQITAFNIDYGCENTQGIVEAEANSSPSSIHSSLTDWYSLDGRKLDGKPAVHGIYIHRGHKVVIK